jgi:glycosyltransferase involved in cell wall biosynthesis
MIYINGRFLTMPVTGVQRYSRELLNALDQLLISESQYSRNISFTCFVPPSCSDFPIWKKINIRKVGQLRGNLWEQIELPFFAKDGLLFSPANIGPFFHGRQVVTIHDASIYAYPDAYSKTFRLKYDLTYKHLARVAKKILTVSEFSKREIHHHLDIPLEKIECVLSGGDHFIEITPDKDIVSRYNLDKNSYFLGVSSQSKHKNLQGLISAFQLLDREDINLLLVGGQFSSVFRNNNQQLPKNVIHLGFVNDSELSALFRNAKALIFPSFYEGFGLPLLEAMSVGCPVICSNTSSLPEIGGDAVLYFDPQDSVDLKKKMEFLLDSCELQEKLKKNGLIRNRTFSWKKAAIQTLRVLQS